MCQKKSAVGVYLTGNKQTRPDYNRHLFSFSHFLTRGEPNCFHMSDELMKTAVSSLRKPQNTVTSLVNSGSSDCLCNRNGFGRFHFIFLGSVQIVLLTGRVVTAAQTRRCFGCGCNISNGHRVKQSARQVTFSRTLHSCSRSSLWLLAYLYISICTYTD